MNTALYEIPDEDAAFFEAIAESARISPELVERDEEHGLSVYRCPRAWVAPRVDYAGGRYRVIAVPTPKRRTGREGEPVHAVRVDSVGPIPGRG